MGAPEIPVIYPGIPPSSMAAMMNTNVRDPFTALLDRPRFMARRTGAQNLTENVHQFLQWDTADEDSHGGWTSPTVVGGGGNTTLSAASAVGDASISVASTAGLSVGNAIRIGTGAATEYRSVASIAGTTINVNRFLALAHASGEAVVEVASDPSRYTIPDGWGGWWWVDTYVSISGTGAAGLVLIPSVAVQGASHTGFTGGGGWEGPEVFVPTGGTTEPKGAGGSWRIYAEEGQRIQIDLWYSAESAITAANVTAGLECRIGLIWDSV